jgi:hypothetical protein
MKAYIGTKVILAEPMGELDFMAMIDRPYEAPTLENRPGYRVVYPDGYVSWSPKDVFEAAYREVSGDEAAMIVTAQEAQRA